MKAWLLNCPSYKGNQREHGLLVSLGVTDLALCTSPALQSAYCDFEIFCVVPDILSVEILSK